MKIFLLFVILLTNCKLICQVPLDVSTIKKIASDTASFRSILNEFNHDPSSLDSIKGAVLYYGKTFRDGYNPFKINFDEIEFAKLISKRKFKEAVSRGEALLQADPANLEILSNLLICYRQLKSEDQATLTKSKIDLVVSSILAHGAGESKENPLKVLSVGDEFTMMAAMGISGISRTSQIKGISVLDIWKAKTSNGKRLDFFAEVLYYLEPQKIPD